MASVRFTAIHICALALTAVTPVWAQHGGANHSHNEPELHVPRSISSRPIPLIGGLGGINDIVTTSSKEAQAYHNQGMNYLHLFAYLQAARSFNEAIRRDPNLAMSYAFLSRAYGDLSDTASAREAMAKAAELAPKTSRREQVRLSIMIRQDSLDRSASRSGRRDGPSPIQVALDSAVAEFPEDPELWLLRSNFAYGDSPKDMTQVAYLEAASARNPDHPAPHHYLIHTYEGIGRIDLAVKHGAVVARLATNAAHGQHMYGHDLRRVGRVEEAIAQFEKAHQIEETIYKTDSIAPKYDWHHPHNMHLLSLSYLHQGRVKEAERMLREKAALSTMRPSGELYNRQPLIDHLVRRGQWDEVRSISDDLVKKAKPMVAAGYLYRGHVALAENKIKEADASLAAAIDSGASGEHVKMLRGMIALRAGMVSEGTKQLKQLIKEMRAMEGPDPWINTLFNIEQVATAARQSGAWELADHAARQMIAHDSAYGGGHLALALVAEQKGDAKLAEQELALAKRCWAKADSDFADLRAVESKLTARAATR